MIIQAHPIPSLASSLALRSPAAALIDCANERLLTYAQLGDAVDALAKCIIASGASPNSRIVITCCTSLAVTIGILATWQAGMVPVPLAKLPSPSEQVRIFIQCSTRMVVCDVASAIEIAVPYKACGEVEIPGGSLTTALLGYGADEPFIHGENDTLALIVYTSGTTDSAKGVMLSARAMAFAIRSMAEVVDAQPGDCALVPLSGSHLYGIVANCYLLATGATVYGSDPQAPGADLIDLVTCHQLDAALFQPQHIKRILNIVADTTYPTIRYVACGSGGISMTEARRLAQYFPAAHHFFYYALSEAPRAIYEVNPHRLPAAEIPLGRPAAGMQLRLDGIHGNQGKRLGEIVVSGPAVAMGYIGDSVTTREKFVGDSFRTGDLGEEIAGEIFYRGRMADLIAWNGVYFSPWETEHQLVEELWIRAAVVGLGLAEPSGERILRVILEGSFTSSEKRTAEAIAAPLAIQLGLALRVESLPLLPRNATGKILRRQILDEPGI